MRTSLIPLRRHLRAALQKQKDVLGYNLAALQFMKRKVDADRTAEFYEQEMDEEKRKDKGSVVLWRCGDPTHMLARLVYLARVQSPDDDRKAKEGARARR